MNQLLAASLALTAVNMLLVGVLVTRRVQVRRRERWQQRTQEYLRPLVLGFLDAGTDLPSTLTSAERDVLTGMLLGYARTVRGPARARITSQLTAWGAGARELDRLQARRAWERAEAAYVLGDIGSHAAAPALLAALGDPARDVRAAAARSLGHLHCREAAAPLLAAISARQIPGTIGTWAVLQLGPKALPHLRRSARSRDPAQRACALQILGFAGSAADEDAVAAGLQDDSAPVREQAARALGRVGGRASAIPLMHALDDPVAPVRAAAATALGRLADPRAAAPLRVHAEQDQFEPARAAAAALLLIDPRLVTAGRLTGGPHLREIADMAALR